MQALHVRFGVDSPVLLSINVIVTFLHTGFQIVTEALHFWQIALNRLLTPQVPHRIG